MSLFDTTSEFEAGAADAEGTTARMQASSESILADDLVVGPPSFQAEPQARPAPNFRFGRLVDIVDRQRAITVVFVVIITALLVLAYLSRSQSNQSASQQQAGQQVLVDGADPTGPSDSVASAVPAEDADGAAGQINGTEELDRESFPGSTGSSSNESTAGRSTGTLDSSTQTTAARSTIGQSLTQDRPRSTISVETAPTDSSASTPSTTETTVSASTVPTTTIPATTSTSVAVIDPGGPIVVADSLTLRDGKDKSVKVLDNDSAENSKLDKETLEIVAPPAHASSYRVHDGHIHYESIDDFAGVDYIEYRICDREQRCGTALITITVTS